MEYKDYYKLLDIDSQATTDEIEKAYRKLARKYHPDVNPEAKHHFDEITEAHQVLAELEKRSRYDQLRISWQEHQTQPDAGEFEWSQWVKPGQSTNGKTAHSRSEFFQTIFNESQQLDSQQPNKPVNGNAPEKLKKREYVQKIDITLEESYRGTTRLLQIGNQQMKVKIPRGASTGTRVRIRGKQIELHKPGEDTKGELFLEIVVTPHPIFEIIGSDLHAELPVDLYTAILGGEALVPSLNKGKIKLRIPGETQAGRVFRLKGLGMPRLQQPDEYGDLLVKVTVKLPENLTHEEIALFEELADLRGL
jgi:curved DNA-binding protein